MAIETKFKIIEIICLRSKDLGTGRARVLKPSDYTDVALWDRIVEEAENNPKNFEIRREEVLSQGDQENELALVKVKHLYSMSREKLSRVAEFYGIPDEGQRRKTLLDILIPHVQEAEDRMKEVAGDGDSDDHRDE